MERIGADFFKRHPVDCARDLIGCVFEWDGCTGRIVETEAYAATGDPACHTFFRPGARRFVADHPAGQAYVYLNYGVHWLFNVLAKDGPMDGFVLFRALEPLKGLEIMRLRRGERPDADLCAGPGKLTKAFGIDGSHHTSTFLDHPRRGIFKGAESDVLCGPRIGISTARELPWRFGVAGSRALSRNF